MTRRDKLPRRAFPQKRKEDKDEKKSQRDRETRRQRGGGERGGGDGGGVTWIFLLRNRSVSWKNTRDDTNVKIPPAVNSLA